MLRASSILVAAVALGLGGRAGAVSLGADSHGATMPPESERPPQVEATRSEGIAPSPRVTRADKATATARAAAATAAGSGPVLARYNGGGIVGAPLASDNRLGATSRGRPAVTPGWPVERMVVRVGRWRSRAAAPRETRESQWHSCLVFHVGQWTRRRE